MHVFRKSVGPFQLRIFHSECYKFGDSITKKKKKSNSKDLFHIFNHYINMQLLLDPNIATIFNVFTTVTQNSYFKHGVLQPIDLKLCLASS